jgi:hypothetical protein
MSRSFCQPEFAQIESYGCASMAHWALNCKNCGRSFEYSKISDTFANYFLAEKPALPSGGLELECPNCHKKANYQRTDLMFQSEQAFGQS